MSTPKTTPPWRTNEAAAEEMAGAMRRKWGVDLRHPEGVRWLASVIGEVRAEVVEPETPPHLVLTRWSEKQ